MCLHGINTKVSSDFIKKIFTILFQVKCFWLDAHTLFILIYDRYLFRDIYSLIYVTLDHKTKIEINASSES